MLALCFEFRQVAVGRVLLGSILRSVAQGLSTQIPRACVSSSTLTSSSTNVVVILDACCFLASLRKNAATKLNPVFRRRSPPHYYSCCCCYLFFHTREHRTTQSTPDPRCFVLFRGTPFPRFTQKGKSDVYLRPTQYGVSRKKELIK